jgi:hypothetical protein
LQASLLAALAAVSSILASDAHGEVETLFRVAVAAVFGGVAAYSALGGLDSKKNISRCLT